MANKNNLEIERRFLLKSTPKISRAIMDKSVWIDQYYCAKGVRVREYTEELTFNRSYIKTIKTNISHGVNKEIECAITEKEFNTFIKTATNKISKRRIYKKSGKLTWEIDIFGAPMCLIIAEVELDRINQRILIPNFIKDVLIMEITGIKEFSNKSLSEKL